MREVCDRYGVLLIADEVLCGSGRCGTWRALEPDGIHADIMTIAKGLGGGYVPLGATLYSQKIAAPITAVDGGPNTGHTFTGHTLACAAAAKLQEIVIRDRLLERVQRQGPQLLRMLLATFVAGGTCLAWNWSRTASRKHRLRRSCN